MNDEIQWRELKRHEVVVLLREVLTRARELRRTTKQASMSMSVGARTFELELEPHLLHDRTMLDELRSDLDIASILGRQLASYRTSLERAQAYPVQAAAIEMMIGDRQERQEAVWEDLLTRGESLCPNLSLRAGPPAPDPVPAPWGAGLRLLYVAAQPERAGALSCEQEVEEIREAYERVCGRGHLSLEVRMAGTISRLREATLGRNFDVLHLSMHGDHTGLVMADEYNNPSLLPFEELSNLLALRVEAGNLRCLVLSACHAAAARSCMPPNLPYAILLDGQVMDDGARAFSRGFYSGLAAGMRVEEAFREGRLTGILHARADEAVRAVLISGGSS